MDPDTLRLLLLVLGVLLVAGIYLWDRYKRALPPARNRRVLQSRAEDAGPTDDRGGPSETGWPVENRGPTLGADDDRLDSASRGSGTGTAGRPALDPEPSDLGDWSVGGHREEPQLSMGLRFDAHGDGDYLSADPALRDDVERKLVIVHLVARGGVLIGRGIVKACAAANLVPGEMGIYHRHDAASGKVLFSVASIVEPGSFPFDDMAGFKTPGLSLFTQLPGVRDGVEIYTEMLTAARELARLLNAEIQDDRHNKLTQQMQDHMRESIIEHRTRVRLARSRH